MYARIAGTGSYLPKKILTNAELETLVDTSDEWIRTRTGIEQRHVAAKDETTTDLAEHASRRAMQDAGVTATDIDLICVGTTTPDLVFPNVGTLLQDRLGIHGCPAFSLEGPSTAFVYALRGAEKLVTETLNANGIRTDQLDWLIPHQANIRIIEAIAKRLDLPMEKVIVTINTQGNTSAASGPLALHTGIRDGRVQRGQMLLLEAFGGGFTWGSALIRY